MYACCSRVWHCIAHQFAFVQGRTQGVLMKVRALVSGTLFFASWFLISTKMSQSQERSTLAASSTGRIDLLSIEKQAKLGDVKAAYALGLAFMTGRGVAQDYGQAAKWFRQSAESGYADAEFRLAYLYEHGQGVRQDSRLSIFYYRAAAG